MDELEILKNECLHCSRCELCQTRHNVVFDAGNPKSEVMFIGEGPGETEDLKGEPFVGKAGQFLDFVLELVGLDRTMIYICNVIKCRPPQNRDPNAKEIESCRDYMYRQIKIINPKVIVCLGRIAACELLGSDFKITRDHGKWIEKDGIKYIATYHPSALLRDERKRPDAFSDFRKIRAELRENTNTYNRGMS